MQNIQELEISNIKTAIEHKLVKFPKTLKSLSLGFVQFNDMSFLWDLTSLKSLVLEYVNVSNAVLKMIGKTLLELQSLCIVRESS